MENCGFVRSGAIPLFYLGAKMAAKLKTVSVRLGTLPRNGLRVLSGVSGSARAVKGNSSAARGYGYAWQKARKAYLAAHPLCAMCSTESNPVAATVVDHIKPHGGNRALFWDKENWQPLCKRCHDSVKQREEIQTRNG